MKFCKEIKVVIHGNRVIVNNANNGEWIKLSLECYELIKDAIEKGLTKQEFINMFYEEEREYISKLLDNMEKLKLLYINKTECDKFRIRIVTIAITSQCNLYCKHCCVEAGPEKQKTSMETIKERMKKIIHCNPESIIITGGEPLCCLEFKEIIEFVKKKYSGKLGLQTNGTLINVDNGKFIAENFDGVDISLDGYDRESCEKIRGKGVFELVSRGIEILKSFNMKKISLSMTTTSYTYNNEKKFMELCKAWGVKSVIRRFAPVGRGIKSQKEFFDIQHIINGKIPYYNPSGICSSAEFGFTTTVCGALKYRFYVGSDAYIYPCGASCMKEFRIENIDKIEDLNWFFKNEKYRLNDGFKKFVSIFPENLSECSQCSVYLFCVGCPLSLYMYKKIGVLEEYCNRVKGENEENLWGIK